MSLIWNYQYSHASQGVIELIWYHIFLQAYQKYENQYKEKNEMRLREYQMSQAKGIYLALTHLPLDKKAAMLADVILKCIFLNKNYEILIQISLQQTCFQETNWQ